MPSAFLSKDHPLLIRAWIEGPDFDRITFGYVHFTRPEMATLSAEMTKANALEQSAKILAKWVREWDLVDDDGNAVPINAPNMLNLCNSAFQKLYFVCSGVEPADGYIESEAERVPEELEELEKN